MRPKNCFSVLLLLSALSASQSKAASICNALPGNVVRNCGFETGNLTGWSLSGNLEGGASGNYFGVTSGLQNSGNFSGYFGVQGGEGTNIGTLGPFLKLSQTVPVLNNEYYSFTFYLQDFTAPTTGYIQYFDASVNGRQLLVLQNPSNPSLIGAYEKFSFITVPGSLNSRMADIAFNFQNDDSLWFLDDVSLTSVGPVPEPSSLLLVAPALGALFFLRRRTS
ncbi:MAG: PEP-CTERM sorting domain-containing protein [Acidobacteriaceae bacterium]|nr:PEP-CTERM sorting domain-containing protein [Acidobacteriaceae bacterium]